MSDTRKIIDFAAEDNAVAFRDALYSAIHDRVTAHIEAKKQEVAQNLITRNEEVEELDEEELDEKNNSHTHAAHYENDKGEWTGMNLLTAKDDQDAIRQAHEKCKDGCRLSRVERHTAVKEEHELDEGKMDDIEDARREKAEKKASNYEFDKKPKKTLATIRKVAGHSDSGAKRDDKEKDED
jgi:hypothetical protein